MPARHYHEELWSDVPAGRRPADFERRLAFVRRHVSAGDRVLDVGCGEGMFAGELAATGARVTGIDVAREPLRRAAERHPGLDLRLVSAEPPSWSLSDGAFDVVWAGEVLEHVADTAGFLSEVRRVLRSGGTLVLSTPDHGPLVRLVLGVSAPAFARHFDPRSDHLRFYTRGTLATLLEDFRFEAVRLAGLGGLPGARRTLLASARRARF
jgi:2-polyprenyl-6-hydroxyphenyl methylase/3-demethylubiquinone-9 3-methyltransferase